MTVQRRRNYTFEEKLKNLREDSGLTQAELADELGVTEQTISAYERGHRLPKKQTLREIADLFGVSEEYLMN